MQRKTTASIAVLLLSSVALFRFPFLCNESVSPLGIFIDITFTCSSSGKPIVGLPVTIGQTTEMTDAQGSVVFGSGYLPGTYTYEWVWWDGPHSKTVTIDCSRQAWYYQEDLLNPEIHKTFLLDTAYGNYPPIQGLNVTLVGYGTEKTDANGYVSWSLVYPFSDEYTIEWVWNGNAASEPVLWQDFVDGVWSKTNYLEPKSGGDKNKLCLLAELG